MPLGLVTCEHEAFWLKLLKTSWTPSKGTKLRFWVSLQDPFISTCLCSVCAWLATRKPGGFGAKQWKVYMKNVIIYSSAKSWAVPLHSAQRPVYTCLQHLLNIYKLGSSKSTNSKSNPQSSQSVKTPINRLIRNPVVVSSLFPAESIWSAFMRETTPNWV